LSAFTTNQKDAREFVYAPLVELCFSSTRRHIVHQVSRDGVSKEERGCWSFLGKKSGRSLVWAIVLILVASLLTAGCQPPQVPDYEATPLPSALRIAYLDGNNLNIMQTDGTAVTLLARDLQPTECAPYYVSPDGQWIAYQQADDGLWIVPTAGGPPTKLSDATVGSVSWFPDSSGVVYTQDDDVYAQWLDTAQPPRALVAGGRRYLFPTWSPDGKYIAFLETTAESDIFNVILIQSDGTGWRTLGTTAPWPTEQALCPDIIAWSPDGTRFLVDSGQPAFVFYVSGGSPVQVGAGLAPTHHAWSPDGRSLTYQGEAGHLWLAKADGSEHRRLTDFPVSQAVWSPQDSQIAYVAQRGDDTALEVVSAETGESRSITGADSYIESSPQWTLDGTSLIFVRHAAQGQPTPSAGIWRAPIDGSSPPQRLALTGNAIQVFAIR
jgi:Tol biopolymer transport system component